MYVHKSNLQNAVDSAALAGAAGYIAGETAEDHPGANIMSDEYLKANLGREYQNLIVKDFQAQTVSGKTYYRVKVTQKSPVYFMTLLGLDPLTDVSADAVAQVGSAGSSSSGFGFKDLIVANHISDLGSIGPNYYYWWRDIFHLICWAHMGFRQPMTGISLKEVRILLVMLLHRMHITKPWDGL